ncbi:Awpm-19-like family protein [Thalictrum thalictroides]|uniref:Awpm-19-like family protein n=1 Tax=Thalictrum thalictroides TaxID=46969 RepID=A0A7J6W922_THATH|nr:Awpm-19-like family protein [Thalictrum thalictroides]
MYLIVAAIGGWAINRAIDHGFIIGPDLEFPAYFSPIYFPMGNVATGFFVVFAMIASVVGLASSLAGINHVRLWHADSMPSAASMAIIAWTHTLLAMGLACKEIEQQIRNARLGFVITDYEGLDRITTPPHANHSYSVELGINAGIDMVFGSTCVAGHDSF